MGDVNEGDPKLALHSPQLLPHLHPKLFVQRRKRLVEQQHPRLGDRRACQRHALLLAARQIGRQPVRQLGQAHLFHHPIGGLVALGLRLPAHPQRKCDVVADGEMRKQRVGLEHHRGAPLDRRHSCDILAADHDLACGRLLVAGDHPQNRRLAATGRSEKAAIGAVGNLQIDAVDHVGDAVIALAETCQFDIASARAHSKDLNDLSRVRHGAC